MLHINNNGKLKKYNFDFKLNIGFGSRFNKYQTENKFYTI